MKISLVALLEIPSISKVFLKFFTPVTLRTWFSQEDVFLLGDLVKRFAKAGKSNLYCMDILSRRVYQCCVYHVGVTSIIVCRLSRRILFTTGPIRLKGGNAKANILLRSCCIVSVTKLFKSSFHVIYWGSWWHNLEANRSAVGDPKSLVIFRKKPLLIKFRIGRVCCISEFSVCSDFQLASKVLCRNCDLMR